MTADAFLSAVRSFAEQEVAPAAAAWSLGERPNAGLFTKAAEIGLFAMSIPTEFGGRGFGYEVLAEACEVLAGADFGFAMSVVNTHNVGLRICRSAPAALRDQHLPALVSGATSACTALTEKGAGSDFAAITTKAEKTGQGWRLSGDKTWIINGRNAGLAILFALCGEDEGAGAIGGFLVDLTLPGVHHYPLESAFSQTSMGTGGFVLEEVMLADDCLILPPGEAFKSVLTEINAARTYVAAMCNGMLRAALLEVSAYGAERQTFGRPLSGHQAWRLAMAQAEIDLAASTALTREAITLIARGEDAQLAAARAKVHAVETCQRQLPQILHAMGAEGLRAEHCFARHLAAVQMAALTDGATDILRERVARLTQPKP